MIKIRELTKKDSYHINNIAKLHKKAFPSFFLTKLGIPFLKTLYTSYIEDEQSGIIVAENDNVLAGFIAYSNDYPAFYKGLIEKHLLKFACCALGAAIRHPSFIKRLFGAFKKSDSVIKKERYVELASICVDPVMKNQGVGTQLINYLKKMVDFNSYSYINLETDADENESANQFYLKNLFRLERTFITEEGRRMNEYRYTERRIK